ncbi:MAG: HIT domain-containing protein [Sedimentisphaerales bacterium]|nr:HIT domain-containing protein [Sedimentisphaerales bacterium]
MANKNIWAPWRISYLKGLEKEVSSGHDGESCFLCDYWQAGECDDRKNLLLHRGKKAMVVMNGYPYSAGHLLIAPIEHLGDLSLVNDEIMAEISSLTRYYQAVLREVLNPHGFNIGINLGRCAGAGLPGHMHQHIVPRWNGDTNFMSTVGDTRTISQSLTELYDELKQAQSRIG